MNGSRKRAWFVTIGLPCVLLAITIVLIDVPIASRVAPAPDGRRGVVAFRDPVHPIETLGTWAFLGPLLESVYDEVHPITQWRTPRVRRKAEFLDALRTAASRCSVVDLLVVSHTNYVHRWVAELPDTVRGKLRLVYNSGCWCGRQRDTWMDLGVGTYVAHPHAASHAYFFVCFVRRWASGAVLRDAIRDSTARADRFFAILDRVFGCGVANRKWLRSHPEASGDDTITIGAPR